MVIVRAWHRVHERKAPWRWGAKIVVFATVTTLVLFPRPALLPIWIERLSALDSVLDPDHPALADLEDRVRAGMAADADLDAVSAAVQEEVVRRLPYAFDWETWGVADFVPTVGEAIALGREDCDGRAVVAASLLRRMGYDAHLVSDLKHVWVVARLRGEPAGPRRELMSPGEGPATVSGEKPGGTAIAWSWQMIGNLRRSLAYGVAVFPLGRELILLAAMFLLTLHPRSSNVRRVAGLLCLLAALAALRVSGADADGGVVATIIASTGVSLLVGGWIVLAVKADGRRSHPMPPG